MTTMQRDPLVKDYLRRLEAASAQLPHDRRAELVGEIEEHVDAALAEAGAHDEATVRGVLDRLGSPEEIAAAAGADRAPRARRETAALIVLFVSCVVPLFGYLIGARLVLSSRAWAESEKGRALLLAPLGVLAGAVAVLVAASSLSHGEPFGSVGPVEIAVLAVLVLSGPIAAAYLATRLPRS
jgi:HAAS domain-containing protein